MALGPFIREVAATIGEFVREEPIRFMAAQPTRRMCVKVDLGNTLKEYIDIRIGGCDIHLRVAYVNLPNTCFRCQFVAHKIKDCPLMADKFKARSQNFAPQTPNAKTPLNFEGSDSK